MIGRSSHDNALRRRFGGEYNQWRQTCVKLPHMAADKKPTLLIIGGGSVGGAVAGKSAQHNATFGDICIASRSPRKCEAIVRRIARANKTETDQHTISAAELNARDTAATVALIRQTGAGIVINAATPDCNMDIMRACLQTGAHYIDTSVAESEGEENMPPPWYANYEWQLQDEFAERRITALLSIGFDPGAVNVFAAYAARYLFDRIDSIDIVDVNAGDHHRYFATNFNPEINLREIAEDVLYWEDGAYRRAACHSRAIEFDFPGGIGRRALYSVGHDELHSLPKHIATRRIEFWMGFSESYLNVFNVLKNLKLLSSKPVVVDGGVSVAPLKVIKAVLPDPASLAADYDGRVCIGNLVDGVRGGARKTVFIYSLCDHQACYADVGAQAISYTTAVPAVTAALLLARDIWNPRRMVNIEELDPRPFLDLMPQIGIAWHQQPHPPLESPRRR